MPLGWIPMLWGCDHWLRAVVAFIPPCWAQFHLYAATRCIALAVCTVAAA